VAEGWGFIKFINFPTRRHSGALLGVDSQVMPQYYIPEPVEFEDPEALKYARLLTRLDPHLRSILYALIRRLIDDAVRMPHSPDPRR